MRSFVVTGIGTEVGKTIVSAILAEHLRASYWKPVQAGDLDHSDSNKISELTESVSVLPEAFSLTQAMSPHAAANMDHVSINLEDLQIPETNRDLVIEGAGGLMVPLNNDGLTFLDVFADWNLPVIVVSKHYLGSINHTLMTIELLKSRKIAIAGLVFVGEENKFTEEIILSSTGVKMLARVPIALKLDKTFIKEQAELLNL